MIIIVFILFALSLLFLSVYRTDTLFHLSIDLLCFGVGMLIGKESKTKDRD